MSQRQITQKYMQIQKEILDDAPHLALSLQTHNILSHYPKKPRSTQGGRFYLDCGGRDKNLSNPRTTQHFVMSDKIQLISFFVKFIQLTHVLYIFSWNP